MKNERKMFLESSNCKELRKIASDLEIIGRWDMSKSLLIASILKAEELKCEQQSDKKIKSAENEANIEQKQNDGLVEKCEKKTEIKRADEKYVERIEAGALIAFISPDNNKAKSAKVTGINRSKKLLKVITEYGAEYIISYKNVLWVKTGKRWPRGVYELLISREALV